MSLKTTSKQMKNVAFSIEHLTGKNTGKIQFFPVNLTEVPIQRNGAEHESISIHNEDSAVSRDGHGKILISQHGKARDFKLVPRKGYYVTINSIPVAEDTFLSNGDIITLGGDNRIKIKFTIHNRSKIDFKDIGITDDQPPEPRPLRQKMKQLGRIAAVFGVLAVTSIIAFTLFLDRSQYAAFQEETREIREEIALQSKRTFSEETISKLVASTYLIAKKSSNETVGIGTGWASSERTLITNAHVAKIVHKLKLGQRLIAIQSVTGEVWELTKAPIFHPGYDSMRQYVNDSQFGVADADSGFKSAKNIEGYDLAMFEIVDDRLFPRYLDVADEETLLKTTSGTNVAYAGFPLENTIFSEHVHLKPNPTPQFGQVTSTSDYFGLPTGDTQNNYLLHHNLPAEGGASGSPIINSAGDVVAVLSAGNVIKFASKNGKEQRISNPVQINFAQRADLIQSMHDNDEFINHEKKIWKKSASKFESRLSLLDKHFLARGVALFNSAPIEMAGDYSRNSSEENKLVAITEFRVKAPKNQGVGIFIRSKLKSEIRVTFKKNGEVIKLNPTFHEQQSDYAMAWINEGSNDEITVLVQSSADIASEILLSSVYFESKQS